MSQQFVIIAHRGDSSAAPENTIEAFDLALAQGFHNFETDCQLSADGIPVVLHDEDLGRVNNGTGPAAAASLEQLQQLDAGTWFGPQFACARIPTLEQVLTRYRGRAHIHLVSLLQKHSDLHSLGTSGGLRVPFCSSSLLIWLCEYASAQQRRNAIPTSCLLSRKHCRHRSMHTC